MTVLILHDTSEATANNAVRARAWLEEQGETVTLSIEPPRTYGDTALFLFFTAGLSFGAMLVGLACCFS